MKIINYENLRSFAYVNDKICKEIKGIAIDFFGLGCMNMYSTDTQEGEMLAQEGILLVIPYNNPWAWMNKQAVDYTDEIIDVLFDKYNLPEKTKIVSMGGSMGGQSALVYTRYAKRTPVACIANCPVCDVVFHFTERDDLPRTLYSALWHENSDINDALEKISPLHLANEMPKISYHIFHCDKDRAVNITAHSEKFVNEMRRIGHNVTYDIVNDRDHCQLTYEAKQKYIQFVIDEIKRG